MTVFDPELVVNLAYPYFGASPDGKVLDKSVSETFGLIEIKCPYKYRNATPDEASRNQDFCLEKHNNILQLKRNHAYYQQVQCQLVICGQTWCDFIVYTSQGIHTCRENTVRSSFLGN